MTFKELLTEEEELNTPEKLKTAVQRGRVPGVKSNIEIKEIEYEKFIKLFKDFPSIYKNAAIKLALKRIMIHNQGLSDAEAYLLYFKNRNKEEAKTEHKELFNSFENGTIDDISFQEKAKMVLREKPKSIKLYEDDTWLVIIPKNFSASCKYGEGTKWCTTSSKSIFDNYSKRSPLIIIINKKQDSKTNPLAKVQFHAKSNSAMDSKDGKIDAVKYLENLPEKIQEILKTQGFNKWNYVLIDAAKNNKISKVKKAIENGADIHAEGDKALRWAADKGHIEVVTLLLDKGADVYAKNNIALQWVAQNGHAEAVKMLLKAGADIHAEGDSALQWAAQNGHAEVVKVLLKAGADVHANDDFALRWAAQKGHTEIVKILLKAGADVHANDNFALRWAAQNGHAEVVTLLLDKGANIHAKDDYALRWASLNGYTEVVKILLKAGADVHADNDIALRLAAQKGHTEVVKLLKQYMKKGKK